MERESAAALLPASHEETVDTTDAGRPIGWSNGADAGMQSMPAASTIRLGIDPRPADTIRNVATCWVAGAAVALAVLPVLWRTVGGSVHSGAGELFLNPPGDVRWVIQILVGCAAGSLTGMARGYLDMIRDTAALQTVRERLAREEALTGPVLEAALRDVPADGPLARAVQAVWNCRQMNDPDLMAATDAALDGAPAPQGGRNVANYLMLLGLLGTVVGLSGVIATLKPQFDAARASGDVSGIISNLQGTITAMGTAFSATAYGISLAAVVGYLTSLLASRHARLIAEVQGFAVAEVAPRLLPRTDALLMQELRALIEQGQRYLLQSVDEARDLLRQNKAFISQSQQFVEQVESTIDGATQNLHAALRDVGENYVVEAARKLIQVANELDRVLGETGPAIHSALRPLVVGAADLRTATESAETTFTALRDPLDRLARQLERVGGASLDTDTGRKGGPAK